MTGIGFSPSDNVQVDFNYFAFDNETGSEPTQYSGFNTFSELKWRFKDIDFKLTPEFATTDGGGKTGNSWHVRSDVSSSKMRLFSIFEKYDPGFKSLYPKKFKLGLLNERLAAGGTFFLTDFIDLTANWKKQTAAPVIAGRNDTEENLAGKILFSKSQLPAISVSATNRKLNTLSSESNKETIKGDLEYQVPQNIIKKLKMKSLRIYGIVRRSWQEDDFSNSQNLLIEEKKRFDNQYWRLDFSPVDLIQFNSYFRGEQVTSLERENRTEESLLNQQQKLFLNFLVDRITGLNVNLRYQSEALEIYPAPGENIRNFSVNRSLQSNLRIFPGKWISFFSPVTFEINYQPTWRGYLRHVRHELDWSEKFWQPLEADETAQLDENQTWQLRGEWRPGSNIIFYSGVDLLDISAKYADSELLTDIYRLNQKLDYRPTMNSLITFQYFRHHEEKAEYAATVRDNPMIWIENRWTERLRTKLNFSYLREKLKIGRINETMSTISPLMGFTYRFPKGSSGTILAEIRNDFIFSFYRNKKYYARQGNNNLTNSLAIDYFPTSVLILRFRWVASYKNQIYNEFDDLSNLVEVRLTAQF
jgi:hypothetical protein